MDKPVQSSLFDQQTPQPTTLLQDAQSAPQRPVPTVRPMEAEVQEEALRDRRSHLGLEDYLAGVH